MKILPLNRFRNLVTALVATALVCACAPPQPPATGAAGNLTREMRRLQSQLSTQEQVVASLEQQVAALEGQLQRQGQAIEELRQGLESPVATYTPQPTRVQPVEGGTGGEQSPTEVYLQAFGDYANGRYQAAINGFETFLRRFPNNSYAANARYWLGDCYFNQQQYPEAITAFSTLVQDHPRAAKSPEALLKIATAQLQQGDTEDARQSVETLKQRYPKSDAVQKALELPLPE